LHCLAIFGIADCVGDVLASACKQLGPLLLTAVVPCRAVPCYAVQRKREEVASKASSSKKPVDPAEAEALARREAARRRVEERTKQAFGLT
jgi:hypothetical protein